MAHPYCNVSGVDNVTDCTLMQGRGRAIYAYVRLIPQASLPNVSNVNITVSDGFTTLTFTNCFIDLSRIDITIDGHIEGIVVLARTWRWEYGTIDGVYNLRNPDGSIVAATEKTPQQLAILLFQAIKEPAFNVLALPNDTRPFVNWECADAWPELQHLCWTLGCEVGLDSGINAGRIWQRGTGVALTGGTEVQTTSFGVDWGRPPDNVLGCAGHTIVQSKLEMENVYLDTDGTLQTEDDVSYKPSDGFTGKDPFDPLDSDATEQERSLAQLSHLKYWRPKNQADGTQHVPGLGTVSSIEDIMPIRDVLAESYDSGYGVYEQPARLEGTFAIESEILTYENTDDHTQIDVNWRLAIPEVGLIITDTPLFKVDLPAAQPGALPLTAADVFMTTSYSVMQTNRNYHQYRITRNLASNSTGDYALRRPDMNLRLIASYQADNVTVASVADNQATVDNEINVAIDAKVVEWAASTQEMRKYRAMVPHVLDGAISQIKIVVSKRSGFNMWVGRNTEFITGLPKRLEQIRSAQVARDIALRELADRNRRRLLRQGAFK